MRKRKRAIEKKISSESEEPEFVEKTYGLPPRGSRPSGPSSSKDGMAGLAVRGGKL